MSQSEPDVSVVRQILLNDCNNFIYNSLPTYLLDVGRVQAQVGAASDRICPLQDIKLVSRNHISKQILMQVEADLEDIPLAGREKWCRVGCP